MDPMLWMTFSKSSSCQGLMRKGKPNMCCACSKLSSLLGVHTCVCFCRYFTDARRRTHRLTGGVTLNHLCWASALGVPTALVARQVPHLTFASYTPRPQPHNLFSPSFQGDDDHGRHIRRDMAKHHVSTDFVRVSSNFTTSVSFVFVDE